MEQTFNVVLEDPNDERYAPVCHDCNEEDVHELMRIAMRFGLNARLIIPRDYDEEE